MMDQKDSQNTLISTATSSTRGSSDRGRKVVTSLFERPDGSRYKRVQTHHWWGPQVTSDPPKYFEVVTDG